MLELRKRESELEIKITSTKKRIDELVQHQQSIEPTITLQEIEHIAAEIKDQEKQLESAQLLQMVIQKKIRAYEANAPVAQKAVEEVKVLYDEGRAIVDDLIKARDDVASRLARLAEINTRMSKLDNNVFEATGEHLNQPNPIQIYQALAFAGSNVPPIKPLPAWTYVSDEEHVARVKVELEEKLAQHEELVKEVNQHGPACPAPSCGASMVVDKRSGRSDTPGQASHGHWHWVCPRCHATMIGGVAETEAKR